MIGIPETGTLQLSCIEANVSTGFKLTTADGRPARLAVVDTDGNVLEAGDAVAREAWNVCIAVQKNFWIGQGHLVVHSAPPGLARPHEDKPSEPRGKASPRRPTSRR